MFDVTEPSIVRAQFMAKTDVSISSYFHQSQNHQNKCTPQTGQIRAENSDHINIFDAAKYFSGLHDDDQKDQNSKGLHHLASIPPRFSSVSPSIDDNGSNYGGRGSSKYRARSFRATPTASSEASWNSQTVPGSIGVSFTKNLSPNSSTTSTTTSHASLRWPRISTKWLIPRRKCPCSGKKSVQVEERIESNTPRMVDLRRSTSSNGCSTNYISSSWYSPRQNSPKKVGTTIPLPSPNITAPASLEPRNSLNFDLVAKTANGISHNHHHPNSGFETNVTDPKVAGPLNTFANHSETIGTTATTAATTVTAVVGGTGTGTSTTTNGFTFPILENPPVGEKKMFNVIAEPPRVSLEVFQPKSHPSPRSRRASYEDDNVLSDGSSDLFEIDSFSTTYPCRDSMDEVAVPVTSFNSSTMKRLGIACRSISNNVDDNDGMDHEPMTPVEPTEGFDRSSLTNFSVSASEIGLYTAMKRESERNNGCGDDSGSGGPGEDEKSKGGGEGNGSNGGGLLSCQCEKAVSVGPGPTKCSAEGGPPMTVRHVSGRPTQQAHHGGAAHENGKWK